MSTTCILKPLTERHLLAWFQIESLEFSHTMLYKMLKSKENNFKSLNYQLQKNCRMILAN